jgi:ADP-ribose pyrophosphatase YjhB (NUDIX family)
MRNATLIVVRDGNKILLGMKKKGFGAGKWNGFGGKVENGETIEAAALRELREESGLLVEETKKAGVITFKFPHKPDWDQVVHVFTADQFAGNPVETEEMKPEWFEIEKIPFDKMWTDDPHWLPHVLKGKFVTATFVFAPDERILEKEVKVV